jgi:hypothetical protein
MSWLSEIAHDQTRVTLLAAILAFIVGLTTAFVALIIGWRQGTSARLSAQAAKASADAAVLTARVAGDRAIATMRLQWVQDLRKTLSEYHSVLVSYDSAADYRKVSELGTHLDLMLNLEEDEQRDLWDVAEEVFRADKDDRIALDPKLMVAGRRVLKKEWQQIKWELRGKQETAMAVDWEAYAKGVEADIAQLKKDLVPLEGGSMKVGERTAGGPWRDVTAESIERNKRAIATYEAILTDVRTNRIKE